MYAYKQSKHQVPFELYIFEKDIHGLSLANETAANIPEQINFSVAV